MLPLVVGMRIALTHKLDDSPDKKLLMHRTGRVHSWEWPAGAAHPSIVYVKFDGATWQLDGIEEPGVYPVRPLTKAWPLDPKRKNPKLKVVRQQLPLTPAYAMTAHASQGKTLPAVILDLSVDKRVDTTFGAVAASRVRSRHDCLILRPFEHWLFNRGINEGPQLLLQKLRGEDIDWEAQREGRNPWGPCAQCRQVKTCDVFRHEEWEKVRANQPALCMDCQHGGKAVVPRKIDSGTLKYVCSVCKVNKIEDAYPRAQLKIEDAFPGTSKKCLSCCRAIKELQCCKCEEVKDVGGFNPTMVTLPSAGVVCRPCQEEVKKGATRGRKGWFTCRVCSQILPSRINPDSKERCPNCASRGTRQKDQHTCHKKGCKRTWHEKQQKGQKRQRFCPDCRRQPMQP